MKKLILLLIFLVSIKSCGQKDERKTLKSEFDTVVEKQLVLDFERLFDIEQTKNLEKIISDFERQSSVEIAIISFDSVYNSDEDFHQSTLDAANQMGVGKKGLDKGIVVGISKKSKKIRVENGKAIEKIMSDTETKTIIDEVFIPYYKKGEFYEGTYYGIKKLIEILRIKLKQ